jgi:hypothetical protein
MEFTQHLETVTNWGMHHNIQGGLLETLQAMRACGSDELHRDERLALRCLMDGFQQMLAPVQNG